jgi:surface antigen
MNMTSYIAASVIAGISMSVSSVAMAGDTYYAAKECPNAGVKGYSDDESNKYKFYKCNCVSYVADKITKTTGKKFQNYYLFDYSAKEGTTQNINKWGSAKDWKTQAPLFGFTVEKSPKSGDIAWWAAVPNTPLATGHVAYVESVNDDDTVNISEYNWNAHFGYGTRNNIKADAYIRKGSGSATKTLSSVGVTCPSSVWDFDSSAGTCNATAYYSDATNKPITTPISWSPGKSTAASITDGVISTTDVSKDTTVKFTATYTEGTVTKTSSEASVVVKHLPDGTDPNNKCNLNENDMKIIESPVYFDNKKPKPTELLGKVQLRYSIPCKAAWGRIELKEKAKGMTVTSAEIKTTRTTNSKYDSPLVAFTIPSKTDQKYYANMALLRISGDEVCAIGKINGKSPTTNPCKKL